MVLEPACIHLRRGQRLDALTAAFFSLLLVCALLVAWPAHAQTEPNADQAASPGSMSAQASPDGGAPALPAVSYGALAETLEDPAARDKLIEQLRALAAVENARESAATGQAQNPTPQSQGTAPAGPDNDAAAPVPPSETAVFSQRVGSTVQAITAQLGSDISNTFEAFRRMGTGSGVTEGKLDAWLPALRVLALTIVATLVAYAVLRAVAGKLFGRLNTWIRQNPGTVRRDTQVPSGAHPSTGMPDNGGHSHRYRTRLGRITTSRKVLGALLALVVDLAASLVAAFIGYVVAVALSDHQALSGTFAFQFLTAFVLIEAVKSVSRAVFATRYDELRLLPMLPETARFWNRWITLLIALTGYCLLVVVPVGQAVFAPSIGRLIGLVIMLCVYVTALRVVWSQRKTVRAGLMARAESTATAIYGTMLRALARTWHWLATLYFTVLLFATQAEQAAALSFMMSATIQSLIAIAIGVLLTAGVQRLESRRVVLPESWNRNFPLLERRVNGYKDPALRGLHLAMVVVVVLVVLDAWHAFDLAAWLDSERGRATVALILRVGIVLGAAALSWTVLASLIEHRVGATEGRRASEREKTLLMLFRNAAAIVIASMTVLVVLSQIGIDIGPLIAGAGVVGLAVGFGAQKLVQDVITGVFIQLENGMNQNDTVEVAGRFGTVEKITVRSVGLRTLDGGYHLIPFSAIDTVTNHTRDFGYHYGEYNIAHRENVDQAIQQLELAFKDLMEDAELAAEVLSDIEIPGVTGLTERGFTIRVLIKTKPGSQWMVQRGFNRLVKRRFDAAGIELPYPQTVIHFGRDRNGEAAPVDVRAVAALRDSTDAAASKPGQHPGEQPGWSAGESGDSSGVVPAPGQTLRPGPASA